MPVGLVPLAPDSVPVTPLIGKPAFFPSPTIPSPTLYPGPITVGLTVRCSPNIYVGQGPVYPEDNTQGMPIEVLEPDVIAITPLVEVQH